MKNTNRFLTMMIATVLGFRGKAPSTSVKVKQDRYPNGFNRSREEARRRNQIAQGSLKPWRPE